MRRRITITYDDNEIEAERALGIARIMENERKLCGLKYIHMAFMSGFHGWVQPSRTQGNLSIGIGGKEQPAEEGQ